MAQTAKIHREEFTPEMLATLESAWDAGMQSAGILCQKKINEMSLSLNITELRIKNWIGNKRANCKGVRKKYVKKSTYKTGPNSYALFARSVKRGSMDGRSYLKKVSNEWKNLSSDQKKTFQKEAEHIRQDPAKGNKKETVIATQLAVINQAIDILESVDFHVGGFGCDINGTKPISFFSSKVTQFCDRTRTEEFLKFVQPPTVNGTSIENAIPPTNPPSKSSVRKSLRKHLHSCWVKSTGLLGPIPYKDIFTNKICVDVMGLPPGIKFAEPGSYGIKTVKIILQLPISFKIRQREETVCTVADNNANGISPLPDKEEQEERANEEALDAVVFITADAMDCEQTKTADEDTLVSEIAEATDNVFEVEKIMKRRRRGNKYEYLLRWKGFPSSHDSWEKEENLNPYLLNMTKT